MASPQCEDLNKLYRMLLSEMGANRGMSLDDLRRLFDRSGDVTGEPEAVAFREVDVGGTPALWAEPAGGADDRVLLCLHGGGCVVGSMHSHRKMFGHLAKAAGCRALVLHYGRAPENPHPGPVNDVAAAYEWLLGQGLRPDHIAFAGDSAGGGLAVTAMLLARSKGLPLPAGAMAMSPCVDMTAAGASYAANAERDVFVTHKMILQMAGLLLGKGGDPNDPLVNPLRADLKGLPPILIQVGADETLLDDSRALHAHARAAGVDVELQEYPEMQHVFQLLAGHAPEADEAMARMAAWVRPKLGLE